MTFRPLLRRASGAAGAAVLAAGALAAATTAYAQSTTTRFVQLGSFTNAANAQRILNRFAATGLVGGAAQGRIDQRVVGGVVYHRVRVGPFLSDQEALLALRTAQANGAPDATLQPPLASAAAPTTTTTATTPVVTGGGYAPTIGTASLAPTFRYVQIGAFTDLGAASALLNRARSSDSALDGVVHSIGRRGGAVHRVMVGPFSSDAEANAAMTRLAQLGVVTTNGATASTGATSAISTATITPNAAAAMAYLNVGAYRYPTNAHQALDRLRRSGMDNGTFGRGFIDSVTTNGETLWRVRFGPIATKDHAAQALSLARIMGYKDAQLATPGR